MRSQNQIKKKVALLNRANDMAACLVAIYNKTSDSDYSTFGKMFEHLKTIKPDEKKIGSDSSEDDGDYEEGDE